MRPTTARHFVLSLIKPALLLLPVYRYAGIPEVVPRRSNFPKNVLAGRPGDRYTGTQAVTFPADKKLRRPLL